MAAIVLWYGVLLSTFSIFCITSFGDYSHPHTKKIFGKDLAMIHVSVNERGRSVLRIEKIIT